MTGITDGEEIVVLTETRSFWGYDEKELGKCTSKALENLSRKIKVFPSDKFRRTFFPNHNLSDDYSAKEAFHSISTDKDILKLIESLNIHYVVLARLDTQSSVYPGTYIVVYAEGHAREDTWVFGEVFDIKQKCESGEIISHVDAEWINRVILPLRYVFPGIPIYIGRGATESEACRVFGEEVAKFLIGQEAKE
jgi:hypothetical protein